MNEVTFYSKSNTYTGDYDCILRSPTNEMPPGLHYHDFYEFVIYLGNAGVFKIENGEYLIKRGDIVMIDMFTPHTLVHSRSSHYERFSICIDPTLVIAFSTHNSNLLDIFHKCSERHPIYHLDEERFQKYIDLVEQYRRIQLNKGQDIMIKSIIHQLMAYAYSDCYTGAVSTEKDAHQLAIITQIINYISAHLSEELSLSQLSKEVSYSEYYICRLFRKLTNKTLTSYVQEKRIERACQMLRQNSPVNKAAEAVGFNNYSYFYKTFRKYIGCSPAEFLEKLKTES